MYKQIKQGVRIVLVPIFLLGGTPAYSQDTDKDARTEVEEYLDELAVLRAVREGFGEDYESVRQAFKPEFADRYQSWMEKNKVGPVVDYVEKNADTVKDNIFTKKIGKYTLRFSKGNQDKGRQHVLEIRVDDGNTFIDEGLDGFLRLSGGDRWDINTPNIVPHGYTGDSELQKALGMGGTPYNSQDNLRKVQDVYSETLKEVKNVIK